MRREGGRKRAKEGGSFGKPVLGAELSEGVVG